MISEDHAILTWSFVFLIRLLLDICLFCSGFKLPLVRSFFSLLLKRTRVMSVCFTLALNTIQPSVLGLFRHFPFISLRSLIRTLLLSYDVLFALSLYHPSLSRSGYVRMVVHHIGEANSIVCTSCLPDPSRTFLFKPTCLLKHKPLQRERE